MPRPDLPALDYLSSDRVSLAPELRKATPPLAKAVAVGGALSIYASAIGGGAMIAPITLGIFGVLIGAWWVFFRARLHRPSRRLMLQLGLSTVAVSSTVIVFCGRVGDAAEGRLGVRYWMEDNPGYRFGRHYAMQVAPFVATSVIWCTIASVVYAARVRTQVRQADPCLSPHDSQ